MKVGEFPFNPIEPATVAAAPSWLAEAHPHYARVPYHRTL